MAKGSGEQQEARGSFKNQVILVLLTIFGTAFLAPEFPAILSRLNPDAPRPNCVVPNFYGLQESAAFRRLDDMGLTVDKLHVFNSDVEHGIVVAQFPPPNQILESCSGTVSLSVSSPAHMDGKSETVAPGATPRQSSNSGSIGLVVLIIAVAAIAMFVHVSDYLS